MTVDSDFLDKGVHVHARARSAGRSARVYSSTTVHTCHEPDAGSSTQTPPPCAAPDLLQWKRPDLPALAVAASPPASTGRHRSRIINMSLFISNTQFICELCDVLHIHTRTQLSRSQHLVTAGGQSRSMDIRSRVSSHTHQIFHLT